MTEGVETAIITAGCTVVVAIVTGVFALIQSRKDKTANPESTKLPESPAPSVAMNSPESEVRVSKPVSEPTNVMGPVRVEATHKQIIDAIESALPYHRDKIRATFVGKRVRWKLVFVSVHHYNDEEIEIQGHLPEDRLCNVWCDALSHEGNAFMLAQGGWEFVVDGTIEDILSHVTDLVDCTFSDVRPASPPHQKIVGVDPSTGEFRIT